MLIPLQEILSKYNIHPKGAIQVGCHWAEEHSLLRTCGIERFVYIEPCKDAFEMLRRKYGSGVPEDGTFEITLCNVACGAVEKEMPMYVSHQNQGQSNSLLEPNLHLQQHPEILFDDAELVKVIPLDKLPIEKEKYDILVMDVQGYEGEVLKGATETLKHIDIIYTEVNRDFTYENNMLIGEMEEFLKPFGFKLVEQYWPSPKWSWGDGCFLHERIIDKL